MAERLSARRGTLPRPRRGRFITLVLAVAVVHGCVTRELASRLEGFAAAARMPPRIEVAYVRTLEPEAPPAIAPAPPPPPSPPRRVARARPAKAASAPPRKTEPESKRPPREAVAPVDPRTARTSRPEELPVEEAGLYALAEPKAAAAPEPSAASAAEASAAPASAAASEPRAAVAAASGPEVRPAEGVAGTEPFDWPASTRVSYQLTGNYRGDVKGYAQVEWIRVGSRYQVNLDFVVGPDFAPIIRRRMTSEGELTEHGLVPTRYDEDTQAVMRDRRRVTVQFEPDAVVLANGQRRERWPGVQDTASQFIQLTFLFTTQPDLLRVGNSIDMPLALPRNTDRWAYEVIEKDVVQAPFGPLSTFHLKPRRTTAKPTDLTAEIWFAPTLRYLPVRIRIEQQDSGSWLDLVIARKPELASR